MSKNVQPPLIVITGPTASGKTGLAIRLAERWGGEIVCADSRTVYKYMDIGTAKPTVEEQERVRHWLLDVVDPGKRFTVADFQKMAFEAIADIRSRGKVPFLVGGTGLYIDSVVLSFEFGLDADVELRSQLEKLSVHELQILLIEHHIPLPENSKNKRYLIRSYEKNNGFTSGNSQPEADTYAIAIAAEKPQLIERIQTRAEEMFNQNIVQETQHILDSYGVEGEAFTGNIYPIVKQIIEGELTKEEAIELFVRRDWQLAKRQITWLKRHDWVAWRSLAEAELYIESILRKYRDA